jgi:hypothetical protein
MTTDPTNTNTRSGALLHPEQAAPDTKRLLCWHGREAQDRFLFHIARTHTLLEELSQRALAYELAAGNERDAGALWARVSVLSSLNEHLEELRGYLKVRRAVRREGASCE